MTGATVSAMPSFATTEGAPGGALSGGAAFPDGGNARMNVVPDAGQLSQVMSQATAPAFVLGAVAAFVAVLLNRMTSVIERIRSLNEIANDDIARAHLKSDIPRLRQRAKLLNMQHIWHFLVGCARRCSWSWDLRARFSGCRMNMEPAFFSASRLSYWDRQSSDLDRR
jgi:hypothetical protein